MPFLIPYIADGTGQLVFFLIVLFWIIAGLLKKASEASKRSTLQPPRRPGPPAGGAAPKPKVPSLSDFLKRIQEMSEEAEKPVGPREIKPERPAAATVVRPPPSPRRPTVPSKRARPSAAPTPTLKRPKRGPKPLETRRPADMEVPSQGLLKGRTSVPEFAMARPAEPPSVDAYAIRGPEEHRITQILGGAVSASAFRKGIILSEILGPPRALRPRRRPAPRR